MLSALVGVRLGVDVQDRTGRCREVGAVGGQLAGAAAARPRDPAGAGRDRSPADVVLQDLGDEDIYRVLFFRVEGN